MHEHDHREDNEVERLDTRRPVPAARLLSDFAVERVGDDLIIFDGETLQYHTLNMAAQQVWRACDGVAHIEAIAATTGLPVEVVETTVGELGEASLLQSPASAWAIPMSRRRAARVIAAGAAGVVGMPVVLSLTAPTASAHHSGECHEEGDSCVPGRNDCCFRQSGNICCDGTCTGWLQCIFGADEPAPTTPEEAFIRAEG